MKNPKIPKLPKNPFVVKSKKSADKLARESTKRLKEWAKGKEFKGSG